MYCHNQQMSWHILDKWACQQKAHGKRSGISTINVGRLRMWINRKMKFEAFIHNDDTKCFHMAI